MCIGNTYGKSCEKTCSDCNGQGTCENSYYSTGGCTCGLINGNFNPDSPYMGEGCTECNSPYYALDNVCVICPVRTYWQYNATLSKGECIKCPIGTANPAEGQTQCQPCIVGTISNIVGAFSWYLTKFTLKYVFNYNFSEVCNPDTSTSNADFTECVCKKGIPQFLLLKYIHFTSRFLFERFNMSTMSRRWRLLCIRRIVSSSRILEI